MAANSPSLLGPEPSPEALQSLLQAHQWPDEQPQVVSNQLTSNRLATLEAAAVRLTLRQCEILLASNSSSSSGIMITASHLPEPYNGLVCVINDTSSLCMEESYLTNTSGEILQRFQRLQAANSRQKDNANTPILHVGRDTRESSEALADLVLQTARAAGVSAMNHGEIPTPCLGYVVHNYQDAPVDKSSDSPSTSYYTRLAVAYGCLVQAHATSSNSLLIDCAGGIAYMGVRECVVALQDHKVYRRMVASNRIGSAPLNEQCGAVHVQQTKGTTWYNRPPIGKTHCAALTGDANRVVFFFQEGTSVDANVIVIPPDVLLGWMVRRVAKLLGELPEKLTIGIAVTASTDHDTSVLREYLGSQIPVLSSTSTIEIDEWDVVFCYNVSSCEMRVLWNDTAQQACQHSNDSECLSALTTLLPPYPDGLAQMLLVDALLQIENQSLKDILEKVAGRLRNESGAEAPKVGQRTLEEPSAYADETWPGSDHPKGDTYESLLQKYAHPIPRRSLLQCCAEALPLVQEFSLVVLFLARYQLSVDWEEAAVALNNSHGYNDKLVRIEKRMDRGHALLLLAFSLILGLRFFKRSTLLLNSRTKARHRLTDGCLLAVLLRLLASPLRGLTASYSTDTVHALTVACLGLHLITCDYTYGSTSRQSNDQTTTTVTTSPQHQRPPFQGGTISLNASFFAAILCSSRLQSNLTSYFYCSLAVIMFGFYPATRADLMVEYPPHQSGENHKITVDLRSCLIDSCTLATSLVAAALWWVTLALVCSANSFINTGIWHIYFGTTVLCLVFVVPGWKYMSQCYKCRVDGPWSLPTKFQ